ncbi:hypothetical protein GO491_07030 [Flavobacteriaceae bacterium Ap0902]|nr:hypothetical protein [Flavobacteriaceae bacterium Ap0902]
MKYSTIIGLLLTAVGLLLYILQEPDYTYKEFYIAALLGLGIGLFLGGIMGYAQKKRKKIVEPKFESKKTDTFINKDIEDDSGLKL